MRTILTVFLLCTTLSGCTVLSKSIKDASNRKDYGPYPDNYSRIVAGYMTQYLVDPESATFTNWKGPSTGFMVNGKGIIYGYRVCVDINSRDKFGRYSGERRHAFLIANNEVVLTEGDYQQSSTEYDQILRFCSIQ